MGTIVVGFILFVIVGFAIRTIVRDKKQGKSCGGDCSRCGGNCH